MNIHALWCHPRSVSTAFERIMRERGDLSVLHEPFMYHHYLTTKDRLFPDFTPEPGHPTTYDDIRAMIQETSANSPVFFKDMAYYVTDSLPLDPEFARQMTHAFLLRDPEFTKLELGHEAQYLLYTALCDMGQEPLIVTADQLRQDPNDTLRRYWQHVGLPYLEHAFTWDDRVPDGWQSVQNWHSEVLQSGAIKPPEAKDSRSELETLGTPYTDYAAHHQPFYLRMRDISETQMHQK